MAYQPTLATFLSEGKNYELLLNAAAEVFEAPIWSKYLVDKYQLSLDWKGIGEVMENSPAASIIDYSSGKPLATRPTASKMSGELVTLGNKYQMSKREKREFDDLMAALNVIAGVDYQTIIDFLIPDIQRAATGPHKTIDRLFLETISTGLTTLTAANNPKGVIWNAALDWGITKTNCAVLWASASTATPLTDIQNRIIARKAKGLQTNFMKMSSVTYRNMIASAQFLAAFKQQIGNSTLISNVLIGLPTTNALFQSIGFPEIELIDIPINVENADGTMTVVMPFADHRVTFSVSNTFGQVKRTYADEQRNPTIGKIGGAVMDVWVSKYRDNDGNEFTESEFNAFPVITTATSLDILITDTAG